MHCLVHRRVEQLAERLPMVSISRRLGYYNSGQQLYHLVVQILQLYHSLVQILQLYNLVEILRLQAAALHRLQCVVQVQEAQELAAHSRAIQVDHCSTQHTKKKQQDNPG